MTQEDIPEETPAKPRRGLSWIFYLRAVYLICLLPLFFAIAAAVMIIERDITAPSWIQSRIEARAAEALGGGSLQFGQISLRIRKDLHPVVTLFDTRLIDAEGLTLTRIPSVKGVISPRGLALQQDVLLQEVQLSGAQINLRRDIGGSLAVAFDAGSAPAGRSGSLAEILDQSDAIFDLPALEALETVRADGLIVNFDDARAGRSWIVDGGELELDLRGGLLQLRGDMALLSGRAEVTTVALSYSSPRGSREADLGLNISDAIASDIAAQSPALTWLRDVEAPITAALRTRLDADGALGPLNATLEIGQGVLQPNPQTRPVRFESAKAYLTFDPARDKITFDQIEMDTQWGRAQAVGEAYLRDFEAGLPRTLLSQMRVTEARLHPSDLYPEGLELPVATGTFRSRFDPFRIEVGELVALDDQMQLILSGEVEATNDGWKLSMDGEVNEIRPEKLMEIWPLGFKPGTRRWLANNLLNGRLFDLHAGLRLAPEVKPIFAAGFEFEDSEVQFMRTMPTITGGSGSVSFHDSRFVVAVEEGVVDAPEGGQLQLAGSVFEIPDARIRNAPAVISLSTESSITAALSVLNQPPFRVMERANLPVVLAQGRASVNGQIDLRLKPRLTASEVEYDVDAELRAVRSEILIPDRRLASGGMRVEASRQGVRIEGPLRLGQVPMNALWSQAIGPDADGRSRVEAEVELSQAFLDEFGIALPPGSITGQGRGQLVIDLQRGSPPTFTLTSNLQGLRVALTAIGWSKAPSTQGSLRVDGVMGEVPRISTLSIEGGGLRATGRIDLTPAKQLDRAVFSRVQVGDWLDAPITLVGRGPGRPVGVEIGGGRLDLRRASFGAQEGDGGPVQIALDRLDVTEGISLTGFRGQFSGAGGFSGQFNALLNGAVAVRGTVAPRNGRSAVRLVSDDAGGVIRAAGFMRNAVGGRLDLTLLPAGTEGTFDGYLSVDDLRVRDAPAIAALLDAISVVGLLQQLDGQGLAFDEVDARFRLTPREVILSEASAVGPGLGLSLDGVYTLASKRMDFQGVVSPFYLVNSIGSVLTRRGEGLIGFNFNIGGTSSAPQISVNPLSVFTPGMFREIFRRPPPELTE